MTREEAIQVLQTALTSPFIYGAYADAISMAIEALADRPTESDFISKAKVLETYSELYWFDSDCEVVSKAEVDKIYERLQSLPSADKPIGECRTCGRNADNGGVYEDGRTKCPIQEHYALLLDGYCHLYEPYDCGAKMKGGAE